MVLPGQHDQQTQIDHSACEASQRQLSQYPHSFFASSAPPASAEPRLLPRRASGPACVSGHGQFANRAGSEQVPSSLECNVPVLHASQGHSFTRSSSPAYPPGFEPQQDLTGSASTNSDPRNTVAPNADEYGRPWSQPLPQPHPYNSCSWGEPQSHFISQSHLHQHQALPHPHTHPNLQVHSETHTFFDIEHQHQGQQTQPPYLPPDFHQHQSSQMTCPTFQTSFQAPLPHSAPQILQMPMLQTFDKSETVLGVPAMGGSLYYDAQTLPIPPKIPHNQQSLQKGHESAIKQQSRKSIYHLTKYFQKHACNQYQPDGGRLQQHDWEPPIYQNNSVEFGYKGKMSGAFIPSIRKPSYSKGDRKQSARIYRNGHDGQYGHQRDSFNESGGRTDEISNCSHSQQFPSLKAGSAKDICMADSHLKQKEERSSWKALKCNSQEKTFTGLACAETQLDSLVKVQQEGFSLDGPGESATESRVMPTESKAVTPPFAKQKAGVSRWLEQRNNKYPTQANMQRKAEERRIQEEMGEFIRKKPRKYLRRAQGALSTSDVKPENETNDKQTDFQEQCEDQNLLEKPNREGHTSQADHLGDNVELPMEMEDSGPIESPYQGQASDIEKGPHEENLPFASKIGVICEQVDKEEVKTPCFAFVFRRKRQEQKRSNSALAVQRQRRLLLMLLNHGVEKDKSHLLQSCRYIVNNHFLQGFHHTSATHLSWTEAENLVNVGTSPVLVMDTTEFPAVSSANQPKNDVDADLHLGNSTTLAGGEKLCSVANMSDEVPRSVLEAAQEMPSCDKPTKELTEGGNRPMLASENYLAEGYFLDVAPAKTLVSSVNCKEQIKEAQRLTIPEEVSRPGFVEQEAFANFSSQFCLENNGSERDPKSVATSHVQGAATSVFAGTTETSFLADSSSDQYEKQALSGWRHLDSDSLHNPEVDSASEHHDSLKTELITSSEVKGGKQLSLILSSSALDTQCHVSSVWDQQQLSCHIPGHTSDMNGLGTGYCDGVLGDEDDILQYMNFDAFDTDSGMCYG